MFSSFEASDQGHSDLKQFETFHYPYMYPQYGVSMSYSVGNMLRTQFQKTKVRGQGHSDRNSTLQSTAPNAPKTKICLDMLRTRLF